MRSVYGGTLCRSPVPRPPLSANKVGFILTNKRKKKSWKKETNLHTVQNTLSRKQHFDNQPAAHVKSDGQLTSKSGCGNVLDHTAWNKQKITYRCSWVYTVQPQSSCLLSFIFVSCTEFFPEVFAACELVTVLCLVLHLFQLPVKTWYHKYHNHKWTALSRSVHSSALYANKHKHIFKDWQTDWVNQSDVHSSTKKLNFTHLKW